MCLQKAQHMQRPRETSGNREKPAVWSGPSWLSWGFRGAAARPVASDPALPLGPQPARAPQGQPRRSQARPTRAVVVRPAGASNGPPGPSSGEWSPAALMCGRPARRQLVPPRRPRAPIDTHQAAGGRERPLLRAPLTVVPGPPVLRVGAGCMRGGAPRRGTSGPAPARLLSASPRSPLTPRNLPPSGCASPSFRALSLL